MTPFDNWPAHAGHKPNTVTIEIAARMLGRRNTNSHVALAMYLRSSGATQAQVQAMTGSTYLSLYAQLIADKRAVPVTVNNQLGTAHKVYALRPAPKHVAG